MGYLWLRRWTIELYSRDRELSYPKETVSIREIVISKYTPKLADAKLKDLRSEKNCNLYKYYLY